jgi:hypothetical protein
MKKILSVLVISFSLFFFSGCIEVSTHIMLNSDGSGEIEETVLLSKEVISMITEFTTAFQEEGTEADEFNIFDEDELRGKADRFGETAAYISGEKKETDTQEGYKARYSFGDISKVMIDQNPSSRIPMNEEGVEQSGPEEYVKFEFTKGNPSELRINLFDEKAAIEEEYPEEEFEEEYEDTTATEEDFDQLKNMMKDMRMGMHLSINGEIVETNATHISGNKITIISIEFNELLNDPEKWEKFNEINPQNFQQMTEVLKDIPGIKIEMNQPLIIKFK